MSTIDFDNTKLTRLIDELEQSVEVSWHNKVVVKPTISNQTVECHDIQGYPVKVQYTHNHFIVYAFNRTFVLSNRQEVIDFLTMFK